MVVTGHICRAEAFAPTILASHHDCGGECFGPTASHHGNGIAPRQRHRTTATASHHGNGIAPRQRHRTTATASHHGNGIAPRQRHRTTATASHHGNGFAQGTTPTTLPWRDTEDGVAARLYRNFTMTLICLDESAVHYGCPPPRANQ
jgi:hypothetical protein